MGRRKKTLSQIQEQVEAKWPGKFRVLRYDAAVNPADFKCLGCSAPFSALVKNLVARGACPKCGPGPGDVNRAASLRRFEGLAPDGSPYLGAENSGHRDRRLLHKFQCPKHGIYSTHRPGKGAVCPKCRGYISPNDPDHLPIAMRGKPCDLYLVEMREPSGLYVTKVGISTSWTNRKRNYAKDGVVILREVRMVRMTLYEALLVEREIKKWMRRVLGRRKCPARKWSGWSESAFDPQRRFPAAFDRELAMFRARRRGRL